MNVLIIGYGRAGKRHKEICSSLNLNVFTFDPHVMEADFHSLGDANLHPWDIVVIASPPNTHLSYMWLLLDKGAWIMCEKPLDDLGGIGSCMRLSFHPFAHRIMISYNYRFHPELNSASYAKPRAKGYYLHCYQYRDVVPEWGLLLDHCSHDLDIVSWKSGYPLNIEDSIHKDNGKEESWIIRGNAGSKPFQITEIVTRDPKALRFAMYSSPLGTINISSRPEMYMKMWQSFLRNKELDQPQWPGINDAIETQKLLEKVWDNAQEK